VSTATVPRRGGRPAAADVWVVVLSVALLWPQHRSGYGLGHDMVFTPHQPFTLDSLGLGSASPRAVPLDALVAIASKLVNGAVLGRVALAVPLLLAGWGSSRLLGARSLPGQLAVAGFAVWNPFVVERLALGQWALLWAYGALPWLLRAADRIRRGDGSAAAIAALVCWLAACSITPTGGLLGAAVAVVLAWSRSLRRTALVIAAAVLLQLPWLLPALTSTAGATSDPRAVAAFAARSERPGGAVLSLLGLGGIWSSDVTPASRGGLLGYLTAVVVVAALVLGIPVLAGRWGGGLSVRLMALAGAGFVLAAAATVPGPAAIVRWTVREVPGAGLLRDGQKWLLPFAVLAVLAAGAAVDRIPRVVPAAPMVLAALSLPLVLLPDAMATLRAPLTPVRYPAEWSRAARLTGSGSSAGSGGDVLVLPFASYRGFDWAPGRSVLDPAPRWLAASTVVDDRLAVSGVLLAGEDRRAAAVATLLDGAGTAGSPAPGSGTARSGRQLASRLAGLGIGWVLVEADTPGPRLPDLSALRPVLTGGAVELYRVPGQVRAEPVNGARRWTVILADLLAAAALLAAVGVKAGFAARSLLHSPVTSIPEDSQWAN